MSLRDTAVLEAAGWDVEQDADPSYREYELAAAIRAIADERRAERERGTKRNVRVGDDVQAAIKAALDLELYAYGLRVIRRANWRGENFT